MTRTEEWLVVGTTVKAEAIARRPKAMRRAMERMRFMAKVGGGARVRSV